MARMIPGVIPLDTKSEAEKKLFPVLRDKLNDHFTIFHSFDLLTHNQQDKFVEGEIDFLILSPDRGILVLEVKSGAISFDGESGTWYQNELPLKKSPFEQSLNSKYQLLEFLTKKLGFAPLVPICHAVCFPDIEADDKKLPSGTDTEICIDSRKLEDLQGVVLSIMEHFKKSSLQTVDVKHAERVRQVLMPYFEYAVTLASRISQEETQIKALTENQCRLLDFIHNRKQALIQGCAGSGKTIMAVKKAKELAAAGNTVLLLAYNELLGESLAKSVKGIFNITAATYHDLCVEYLEAAGRNPPKSDTQQYWEKELPEAFAEYISANPLKFDAVIIDEGQDFRVEYWVTIEEMRKEDSYLYIFYDPDQNLFKTDMDFPIKDPPFLLSDNCRNTRNIFNLLKSHTSTRMQVMEGTPEGTPVKNFTGDTDKQRWRHLRDIVVDLIEDQHLKPENIVILGGHSMSNTCLNREPKLGNYTVCEGPGHGPNIIDYHTYMKFKGCEADAVILLDVDNSDPRWSDLALYTAASRAKHLLYIIHKN